MKNPNREKQINVRVEPRLLKKIDAFLAKLEREVPSQVWTRSSVARQALYNYFKEVLPENREESS